MSWGNEVEKSWSFASGRCLRLQNDVWEPRLCIFSAISMANCSNFLCSRVQCSRELVPFLRVLSTYPIHRFEYLWVEIEFCPEPRESGVPLHPHFLRFWTFAAKRRENCAFFMVFYRELLKFSPLAPSALAYFFSFLGGRCAQNELIRESARLAGPETACKRKRYNESDERFDGDAFYRYPHVCDAEVGVWIDSYDKLFNHLRIMRCSTASRA